MTLIEELGNQMLELAKYAVPGHNHDDAKQQEYYRVQKLHRAERERLNAQEHEHFEPEFKMAPVNAYGEATDRYITTSTYERIMRAQDKEIFNFLK